MVGHGLFWKASSLFYLSPLPDLPDHLEIRLPFPANSVVTPTPEHTYNEDLQDNGG